MSDKYKAVIVTFEKSISEETLEMYQAAIRCFAGVLTVEPIKEQPIEDLLVRNRTIWELRDRLDALVAKMFAQEK